jgi:hypothetical protein
MGRIGRLGLSCLLVASAGGCKADGPSLSDDGPERSCTPPSLTVVGHEKQHGPLPVHPGQTLRIHGRDYTDDCGGNGAGLGQTIPQLQLVLQARFHVGPVATVHPRGADSAFTAVVTIPPTTAAGPAKIFDVLAPPHGVIRLVVRR